MASLLLCAFALKSAAVATYPFVAYFADQYGNVLSNKAATITAWPPANFIVGVGTNLVLSSSLTLTSSVTGGISNNLAPGNYRLDIGGLPHGITFGIVSNNAVQNLAQVAGVPVVTFMNFTLAQFSDAGTMAYRSTNDFALSTRAGITNALALVPANAANTNDFARATPAGISNSLAYIPANAANTNDFARATPAGISNSLAYIPANAANTNDFARATPAGISNSLAYIPANAANTNDFARTTANGLSQSIGSRTDVKIITNGFIVWLAYQTNNVPGPAFTNLPQGSLLSDTNGGLYRLTNIVWVPIAL